MLSCYTVVDCGLNKASCTDLGIDNLRWFNRSGLLLLLLQVVTNVEHARVLLGLKSKLTDDNLAIGEVLLGLEESLETLSL